MSHELEMSEAGESSFVWRKEGGAPWHRLGVPVAGHQTAETILPMAGADYEVTLLPVKYITPNGVLLEMEDRFITARLDDDGGVGRLRRGGQQQRNRHGTRGAAEGAVPAHDTAHRLPAPVRPGLDRGGPGCHPPELR